MFWRDLVLGGAVSSYLSDQTPKECARTLAVWKPFCDVTCAFDPIGTDQPSEAGKYSLPGNRGFDDC